jgi:hypothetical protein
MFMIEIAESEPPRRFSLQHIERIAQRQDLGAVKRPTPIITSPSADFRKNQS